MSFGPDTSFLISIFPDKNPHEIDRKLIELGGIHEVIDYFLNPKPPKRKMLLDDNPDELREKLIAELDLHGYSCQEAEAETIRFIRKCERESVRGAKVIVGRGKHSADKNPRLKPGIHLLLERDFDLDVVDCGGHFQVNFF